MKNVTKFFFTVALIMTCGVITSLINYSPVPIFLALVFSWVLVTGVAIREKLSWPQKQSFVFPDEAATMSAEMAKSRLERWKKDTRPVYVATMTDAFSDMPLMRSHSLRMSYEEAEKVKHLISHNPEITKTEEGSKTIIKAETKIPAWWKGSREELEQFAKELKR